MTNLTIAFFGHRDVYDWEICEKNLENILYTIISENEYVTFLVGRNGGFDLLVTSLLHRIKKELVYDNTFLELILPYMTAEYRNNAKNFGEFYDSVEICAQSEKSHFKNAITTRNKYMAERADLVIA